MSKAKKKKRNIKEKKLFKYAMKIKGPNIEPCGAPYPIVKWLDLRFRGQEKKKRP